MIVTTNKRLRQNSSTQTFGHEMQTVNDACTLNVIKRQYETLFCWLSGSFSLTTKSFVFWPMLPVHRLTIDIGRMISNECAKSSTCGFRLYYAFALSEPACVLWWATMRAAPEKVTNRTELCVT
jgi:hypothetical protein